MIVNTVTASLDLSHGVISKALLQAAGPQIQTECKSGAQSDRLQPGQLAVVTSAGNMVNVKFIFHVVLAKWDGGQGQSEQVSVGLIGTSYSKFESSNNGGHRIDVRASTLLSMRLSMTALKLRGTLCA